MNNVLLKVNNLTIRFGKDIIIENLSFQVERGETLTILGSNGAGKSVLLKALLGLLPYEGRITWNQKLQISYLPQGLNQLRVKDLPLTVQDFFILKDPSSTPEEVIEYLRLVGLEKEILHKTAGNVSGGQFQRMLVAWALISHPQMLFFDEPTSGIDIGGGETVYSLLEHIREKERLTIFLVTHDLSVVYKHSTNVLCLNRKGHPCFGAPKEILTPKMLEQTFGAGIKFYQHR